MGRILQHWHIPAAIIFAVIIISGAYSTARTIGSPSLTYASSEAALLETIASKDLDNDGLPDWAETLYGTDLRKVDTKNLGMTDGEAVAKGLIVPDALAEISIATSTQGADSTINYAAAGLYAPSGKTLTGAFARNFFTLYLSAKQENGGREFSSQQTAALANRALGSLSEAVVAAPNFKSTSDIKVSGSGEEALRTFAAQAEAVLRANITSATTSELIYFLEAVERDDSAIANLLSLARAYRRGAIGLAALSVPEELIAQDLALINSLMRVSEIINDFARVNTDPLSAMLALKQYVPAASALGESFVGITAVYKALGIDMEPEMPGASFVNLGALRP